MHFSPLVSLLAVSSTLAVCIDDLGFKVNGTCVDGNQCLALVDGKNETNPCPWNTKCPPEGTCDYEVGIVNCFLTEERKYQPGWVSRVRR